MGSVKCLNCGCTSDVDAIACPGCGKNPSVRAAAPLFYECRACHKPTATCVRTYPHQGTGCIVALIGLVFCIAIIGIPVVIYGLILHGKVREEWSCPCGFRQVNE